jgi:hypothetical protein
MSNEPEIYVNGVKMRDVEEFTEVMDEISDGLVSYTQSVAEEFGVSLDTASAIVYLRSRSRWTVAKEEELIERDKKGNPISLGTVLSGEF